MNKWFLIFLVCASPVLADPRPWQPVNWLPFPTPSGVQVFNDETHFSRAISKLKLTTTRGFDSAELSFSETSGMGPGSPYAGSGQMIHGKWWDDVGKNATSLDGSPAAYDTLRLNFADPVKAFGADFHYTVEGGLDFWLFDNRGDLIGQLLPDQNRAPGTLVDGFFGFTSNTPIGSILVDIDGAHCTAGQAQRYTMDKVEFAPVPEPATWILLSAGAGLACVLRMRSLVGRRATAIGQGVASYTRT